MRKARAVIALTEGDAGEWRKVNPHVKVIPNVVNLNNTGRLSDCSSKNVIFVGRYSRQKDVWSLLKIWQLVHRRHPDWTLNLFGDQRDVLLVSSRLSAIQQKISCRCGRNCLIYFVLKSHRAKN